jgi:hypothetical protein
MVIGKMKGRSGPALFPIKWLTLASVIKPPTNPFKKMIL